MNGNTVARPQSKKDSHWYTAAGDPCYEIMGKTTGKPRPVNLADAKKQNLLPGVSTILKVLHKEGLVNWLIEQAVLACLTTPRKEGEELDAFIERVLHVEKVQEEEGQIARDKGVDIHDAMEALFSGLPISEEIKPWVMPAYEELSKRGVMVSTEQILVGDGYAGRTDLILSMDFQYSIWDFKSTKKLPDPRKGGAWPEHRLQLSAYAQAFIETAFAVEKQLKSSHVNTGNVYISTVEQGKFVICEHGPWSPVYWNGFSPLVTYWQWANGYVIPSKRANAEPVAVQPAEPVDIPSIEEILPKAAPAAEPRKRKVSVDVGVPTAQNPRVATMVPPPMPPQ